MLESKRKGAAADMARRSTRARGAEATAADEARTKVLLADYEKRPPISEADALDLIRKGVDPNAVLDWVSALHLPDEGKERKRSCGLGEWPPRRRHHSHMLACFTHVTTLH
jgi:hypothetical protein